MLALGARSCASLGSYRGSLSGYPAYTYESTARVLEPAPRAGFEVLPGGGADHRRADINPVITIAKLILLCVVSFAIIGAVRITLSSSTVTAALEAKQIQNDISFARSSGSELEVVQSTLSNPTRIKSEAESIGMVSPANVAYMDMSGDIVVKDATGALSLTGSIGALSAASAS